MSQWTHVNASLRIDGISGVVESFPEEDLGKPARYEDDNWDGCILPCGSEGSLDYSVWTNPDTSCIAMYTVSIFGDLRDYSDDKEILTFFNKLTKGKMIRSGVLEIDIEGKLPLLFVYSAESESWIRYSKDADMSKQEG